MKKYIFMAIVIFVASVSLACVASEVEDDYIYEIENGEAVIQGTDSDIWYNAGGGLTLDVPSSFGGYLVTKIESLNFEAHFVPVTNVQINLPATIREVSDGAFDIWISGTKQVSVDIENPNLMSENGSLYSKDKSTLIFCGCVDDVYTVPGEVTKIETRAFEHSYNKILNIPETVEEWEALPGYSGWCIEEINVEAGNKLYSSQHGALYSKDFSKLVVYPKYKTREAIIANSVKEFADRVFYNCKFDSIILPSGMAVLPAYFFDDCKNLRSVNLPEGMEEISFCAFSGCTNLNKVYIPDSVTKIANTSFNNCEGDLTIVSSASAYAHQYAVEYGLNWKEAEPYLDGGNSYGQYYITSHNLPIGDYVCVYVTYGGENYVRPIDYIVTNAEETSVYIDGRDFGNANTVSYVKLFCWDSLENMQPICEPLRLDFRSIDYRVSREVQMNEPCTITLYPGEDLEIIDYIKVVSFDYGNDNADGYTTWEMMYNTSIGKNIEIAPDEEYDFTKPIPVNGKTQLEVKQNGIYIFHAKDKNGRELYQGVDVSNLITTPHIENVEVTVGESNFKADITFDFISNPLAGETKMAMKKYPLFYYPALSTATIESMVQGFFENYKGEYITGNKITVTENAQYHIYCIDEWGNGSFYIVKVNSIPDIAYTLSRNEVGNEPVTISFNPKTGEVVDYIPETYIYITQQTLSL